MITPYVGRRPHAVEEKAKVEAEELHDANNEGDGNSMSRPSTKGSLPTTSMKGDRPDSTKGDRDRPDSTNSTKGDRPDSTNSTKGDRPESTKGGGMFSTKGGGMFSTKGGGMFSTKGGGLFSTKGGGQDSSKGDYDDSSKGDHHNNTLEDDNDHHHHHSHKSHKKSRKKVKLDILNDHHHHINETPLIDPDMEALKLLEGEEKLKQEKILKNKKWRKGHGIPLDVFLGRRGSFPYAPGLEPLSSDVKDPMTPIEELVNKPISISQPGSRPGTADTDYGHKDTNDDHNNNSNSNSNTNEKTIDGQTNDEKKGEFEKKANDDDDDDDDDDDNEKGAVALFAKPKDPPPRGLIRKFTFLNGEKAAFHSSSSSLLLLSLLLLLL